MYKIMVVISLIIRTFCLPDPFECFGNYAILINLVVEAPIHLLVYKLVGTIYSKGSFPPLGALLYLLVYCTVIGILWLMSLFSFAWWWVIIIIVLIVLLIYGIHWLREKIFNG